MKKVALGVVALVVLGMLGFGGTLLYNQQIADPDYAPTIAAPQREGVSPSIAVDSGHSNFHVLDGRFAPFGILARHAGFEVSDFDGPITPEALAMDILVIANAAEALDANETDHLVAWVEGGGSLLLIADHAPFGGHARELAARFGVGMGDGFVISGPPDDVSGTIDFSGSALGDHPIFGAGDSVRRVQKVRSFTGQSLTGPDNSVSLLVFPDDASEFPNREAVRAYIDGGSAGVDVGGKAQALALEFGKGRVVVSGEAAMFTSQKQRGRPETMGIGEVDNEAYVINVLDWLARLIDEAEETQPAR